MLKKTVCTKDNQNSRMKLYVALHREQNFNMLLMENLNPILLSNAYLYNIIFS